MDVPPQIEPVGDEIQVAQDLRLAGTGNGTQATCVTAACTPHLLDLEQWQGIPMVTPRAFLTQAFPHLLEA